MDQSTFAEKCFIPFAQSLYSELYTAHRKSNFCISPLSIYSALSLLLPGTESNCRTELLNTLQLKRIQNIHSIDKSLGRSIQDIPKGDKRKTLVQANGLFVDEEFHIKSRYNNVITNYHNTVAHELNFSGDCEEARDFINTWVSKHTKKKIKKLLPRGTITGLTRLVLANAVYFKGKWLLNFDKKETNHNAIFHTLSDGDVKTSMMRRKGHFFMADFPEIEARCLKIPFKCHEMLIVLPDEECGLPDVIKVLKREPKRFLQLFEPDSYFQEEMILKLPRFSFGGESMELKRPLVNMGLESIFSSKYADLSGITGDKSLFVSSIFHQATIEVDEEGAEAAAATAIPVAMRLAPKSTATFRVDHPFLFFIVTKSGFPVFMGHVVEPEY